jgi:hypothetical protein
MEGGEETRNFKTYLLDVNPIPLKDKSFRVLTQDGVFDSGNLMEPFYVEDTDYDETFDFIDSLALTSDENSPIEMWQLLLEIG